MALTTPSRQAMERTYTAQEVMATVKAVATAERFQGREIMAHVRSGQDVSPESAQALRELVVAAYVELLVGL